ncbi:MAG: phage tail protein [Cetobacterium sp.]|uniref:phage tail protein n=1 Tax=Cetobacterium sp. TaxID=2071632 RepID=UPI003EE4CC27
MANINFPANPVQGQEYTFNKFKYVFEGNRWQSARNDSSSDLDYFIKDLGAPNSDVMISGVKAKDFIDQKDGIPATAVVWFPSREANHEGYIPADGQLLDRKLYASLWKAIEDKKVPVVTDAAWNANADVRGSYTEGDGSTTFRVPDYNGKIAGSKGSAFLRGDGLNAGAVGHVQGDAIREIEGTIAGVGGGYNRCYDLGITGDGVFARQDTAGWDLGDIKGIQLADPSKASAMYFKASHVVPTSDENRPTNVTGVWMIKAFSYVENEGVIDAGQLVTALAEVDSKVTQALENRMSIANPVAKETTPYGLSDFNVPRTATIRENPNWFIANHALRFMDGASLYRAATNNASHGQAGVIDWAWISKFQFQVKLFVSAPSLNLFQHTYAITIDNLVHTNATDIIDYPYRFTCHAGVGSKGIIAHRLVPGTENYGFPYFELHLPTGVDLQNAPDKEIQLQIVAIRLWG